ncbi:unnamed protein product [Prorocentrum cordatum]|uniref:Uncharacterized protein n=1 Tax=Prorocentrum cordatum TaxID=2364126 RepID=A0ABN9QSD1_9DINO|nr:unnamed protein product [Polarella glacialis]
MRQAHDDIWPDAFPNSPQYVIHDQPEGIGDAGCVLPLQRLQLYVEFLRASSDCYRYAIVLNFCSASASKASANRDRSHSVWDCRAVGLQPWDLMAASSCVWVM